VTTVAEFLWVYAGGFAIALTGGALGVACDDAVKWLRSRR
jgi:hypothetical protein